MGKAAEHLVCADLLMKGYKAFLSAQGLPYDVIDLKPRLVSCTGKGTAKPKTPVPGLRSNRQNATSEQEKSACHSR
jgi:hypothetical protein